jgi:hypothetical protein
VYRNLPRLVELLLDVGDVPIEPERNGEHSPLVAAAQTGNCDMVELLGKRNASALAKVYNPVTRDSEDAVAVAVGGGHFAVLEALLLCSMPVTYDVMSSAIRGLHQGIPDDDWSSNLRERMRVPTCKPTCETMRERVLELLLRKGYPLDGKSNYERKPIAMAARAGCLATLRLLWRASGDTDDARRHVFRSDQIVLTGGGLSYTFDAPMCAAAESGNVELLEQLHNWTGRRDQAAASTLHFVTQLGRVNVARWLRRNGLIWPGFAPFGDRQIYSAAYNEECEIVHMIASTDVHPDDDHVFDNLDDSTSDEANRWPSIRKLAHWGRDDGLLLVLAAAPGAFATRKWLGEYCDARALSSLRPRRRGATAQRLAAIFVAAGAPVDDAAQQLIDSDESVRAAVECARADLAQERDLARQSLAQFWFADVGCARVTDVALALDALQLPVLVVVDILAHEDSRFARVPVAWIWERVDRVRGCGGAHDSKRRRVQM